MLLPPKGELRAVERFIPAGWFSRRRPGASGTAPRLRVWVNDFAIASRPISFDDYAAFLNDLVERGDGEQAVVHLPRLGRRGSPEEPLLSIDAESGRFSLRAAVLQAPPLGCVPRHRGHLVRRAGLLPLAGAADGPPVAPADRASSGRRAARGVDARVFPWGGHADPAFHCMQDSALPTPGPPPTRGFPVDQSPYGVFGLAGGVQDWCADVYRPEGPKLRGSTVESPAPPTEADTVPQRYASRRSTRGAPGTCRRARSRGLPERRATRQAQRQPRLPRLPGASGISRRRDPGGRSSSQGSARNSVVAVTRRSAVGLPFSDTICDRSDSFSDLDAVDLRLRRREARLDLVTVEDAILTDDGRPQRAHDKGRWKDIPDDAAEQERLKAHGRSGLRSETQGRAVPLTWQY